MLLGFFPIIISGFMYIIFKETPFKTPLSIYLVLLGIWQLNVAVLYFYQGLSIEVIEWIYRVTRFAPIFIVPVVIYISIKIYELTTLKVRDTLFFDKLIKLILNKMVFYILLITSITIYIANLFIHEVSNLVIEYTGELTYLTPRDTLYSYILDLIEVAITIIVIIATALILPKLTDYKVQNFVRLFFVYTVMILLGSLGLINKIPVIGNLIGTFIVIAFCLNIIIGFFQWYLIKNEELKILIEREKKVNFTNSIASSLIHEIRNPIHHIKGFTTVVAKTETLSEQGKECLDYIDSAAEQLDKIVNSFNHYIQYNQLEFSQIELNDVIDNAVYLLRNEARVNKVNLNYHKQYSQLKVLADGTGLTQVMINILKNCIESIPEERKEREVNISVDIQDHYISIHVLDTGKGIHPDKWESIFDPFITDKKRGMGIGLAYSRRTLYEHGGDLRVVSSSPKGTHFEISFPQHTRL